MSLNVLNDSGSAQGAMTNSVDVVSLKRNLIITLGFILTVVLSCLTVISGNPLFMLAFVALPLILILLYYPSIAFVMAFIMDATGMAIPGVSYTTLGLVAKLIVLLTFTLAFFLRAKKNESLDVPEGKPLKWLVFIIFILMVFRGSGLRMLGSSTWGGMAYIVLLIGIFFFFVVRNVTLSDKQLKTMIWGMGIAGLLGSLFDRTGWIASTAGASENVTSRISWLQPFVWGAIPLVFASKWKFGFKIILWIALLALMAMTGFRSKLVGLISITIIYGFFSSRSKAKYVFSTLIIGAFLWGLIVVASPMLPRGIQRTVSFIPGISIGYGAAKDAQGSIEWRLEIWRYCLDKCHDYLLIGRGSAFEVMETAAGLGINDIQTYSPFFAFETRSYHSGPLALLIDYGIPGLVIASWFMILLLRRFWRYGVLFGSVDSFACRYALYWSAFMIWHIISFYLVYGSMVNFANRIVGFSALAFVVAESAIILIKRGNVEVNKQQTLKLR